jgi:hypothetical protein
MNRIIVLLLAMVLMSCSKSLDIQLEAEVEVFFSNDTEQKIRLTKKDEVYVALNEWLHNNRTGWYATSGRYPGGVYIKSGVYGIQVTESKVVIYSTTSKKPKAIFIQEIQKGELSKVIHLGE